MTAPLTPEREQEIAAELHAAVRAESVHFIETAGWQALELPRVRDEFARHIADALLPQVLADARLMASYGPAIQAAEERRGALETELADARASHAALEERLTAASRELAARPTRAAVLREAQAEVVAWLAKKSREHRARGPQYARQADLIATLADKVRRGAVRVFLAAEAGESDG